MKFFPAGPVALVLASLGCGNDAPDPAAPGSLIDASVSPLARISEGAVLELRGQAKLLKTGAVRVRVQFGCAEGLEVLEANVSVSQSSTSGMAGLGGVCTGRHRNFHVIVTALEGPFQPGETTVSAFVLVIDPATGLTQQAQDTRTLELR